MSLSVHPVADRSLSGAPFTGAPGDLGEAALPAVRHDARNSSGAHQISPRDVLIGVALALLSIAATFDAWRDIFRLGTVDEELSYVLLAPPVIAWLFWVRRHQLYSCTVRSGWFGLFVLVAGWLIYWYGHVSDPVIWRGGAVVMAVGAFCVAIGWQGVWKLAPCLAACIFLIPVSPDGRYHVAAPLQNATAHATQWACDVLSIDVDRSGALLTINGVDVTVAEACNGMRMIVTLVMVCYVVAFTLPLRPLARFMVLAASPLVAIGANVLRLVPTVWMFGNRSLSAAEKFHDISGWVMTILAFLLLLGFCQLLIPEHERGSETARRTRTTDSSGQAQA